MLLAYSAKKRAEVAPGVGEVTDMFIAGWGNPAVTTIAVPHLEKLQEIYERQQAQTSAAIRDATEMATQYVDEIAKAAAAQSQTAPVTQVPEVGSA